MANFILLRVLDESIRHVPFDVTDQKVQRSTLPFACAVRLRERRVSEDARPCAGSKPYKCFSDRLFRSIERAPVRAGRGSLWSRSLPIPG